MSDKNQKNGCCAPTHDHEEHRPVSACSAGKIRVFTTPLPDEVQNGITNAVQLGKEIKGAAREALKT